MATPAEVCLRCGCSSYDRRLSRCSICGRFFCRLCGLQRHGKWFCGLHCADLFFFGDEDEPQEED
jgi:hypothetical protein